jgi:amidase
MTALHELSAVDQGRALRAGEVSPTELVSHYMRRIEALDSTLASYVTVTADAALAAADASARVLADARRGDARVGPLFGVPIAVKDTVRIEGVRCTRGSAAFADDVADLDDHVVTRIKDAGMIILGTTNTPEFALPCYTENELGQPTRNPWSHAHSPGGSSGGSAAAVAAGLAPLGHGTDAGGSVRIPASACGLVGIKPSRGRVSNGPVGHDVTGLSVQGALGRSVGDAAALLRAMAGVMPGDTYTAPPGVEPGPGRLRVASMPAPMLPDVTVHPDCLAAVAHAAELLTAAGHAVEEIEMSPDAAVAEAFGSAWSVVAAGIEVDAEDEELLTPFTRYMRARGRAVGGVELHAALSMFRGIGQMLADMFFATYDVILTPTLATPPALIGEFSAGLDPAGDFDRMSRFMPYTPLYNITGLPAVSLPLHSNTAGLPIGVMLGGRYGDEATLLRVSAELEAAAGQLQRRPRDPAAVVEAVGRA